MQRDWYQGLHTGGNVKAGTNFHMASISKAFVGVSLLQLALVGKIGLGKPVVDYLPASKLDDPRYKQITICQMLKHRSGVPDMRFTFHFTPTFCSWLKAVEGFFAKITKRRLKRGVFQSVFDVKDVINRFVAEHNDKSKPFTTAADPNKIIAAIKRGHQGLDSIH